MSANKNIVIEVPEALLARIYQATGKVAIVEALEVLLACLDRERENAKVSKTVCSRNTGNNKAANFGRNSFSEKRHAAPVAKRTTRADSNRRIPSQEAKYYCRIFDAWVTADSLREIWVWAVDKMYELDPGVIERLQARRTPRGTRRYCADRPDEVHIGAPHLITEVARTKCGKYVSFNFNVMGCRRYLQVLCKVAGLEWGKDMEFVVSIA